MEAVAERKSDEKLILLTVKDLAEILKKSPSSVKSDLTRNPQSLPPSVRIPSSRRVLFRLHDVKQWLEDQVE